MTDEPTTCPGEGLLLRYLDDEVDAEVRQAIEAHLSACPACERALDEMRRRALRVGAWIRRHDPEPPSREAYDLTPPERSRHGMRRWLAAAAIVVAVGTLVGPVRAGILDALGSWLDGSNGDSPPAAVAPPDDPSHAASPGTSFVYGGAELTLVFDSPDTRGVLTIGPASDSLVMLRSPHRGIALSVRRGTVDVGNRSAPAGDYSMTAPSSLDRVRLRVRGAPERLVDVRGLHGPRTIPLSTPSPSGGASR